MKLTDQLLIPFLIELPLFARRKAFPNKKENTGLNKYLLTLSDYFVRSSQNISSTFINSALASYSSPQDLGTYYSHCMGGAVQSASPSPSDHDLGQQNAPTSALNALSRPNADRPINPQPCKDLRETRSADSFQTLVLPSTPYRSSCSIDEHRSQPVACQQTSSSVPSAGLHLLPCQAASRDTTAASVAYSTACTSKDLGQAMVSRSSHVQTESCVPVMHPFEATSALSSPNHLGAPLSDLSSYNPSLWNAYTGTMPVVFDWIGDLDPRLLIAPSDSDTCM